LHQPIPLTNLHANSIEGVIQSLDRLIEWSNAHSMRAGYFAALYRKVTINVKQGIAEGRFDNGARMERLDVIFANRYLDAFEQYYAGQPVSNCWRLAFEMTEHWSPLVIQHLMLGMNAHINLDLGIAAAQTVSMDELPTLKPDFDRINDVLSALIDDVEKKLAEIWPALNWIDALAGRLDEKLADGGMVFARDKAWAFALSYAAATDKRSSIRCMDARLYILGQALAHVSFLKWFIYLPIRLSERGNVRKKIQILA